MAILHYSVPSLPSSASDAHDLERIDNARAPAWKKPSLFCLGSSVFMEKALPSPQGSP